MATILSKIVNDLKELHNDFKDIEITESGEAVVNLKSGDEITKSDIDQKSKTYQILEVYEQVQ